MRKKTHDIKKTFRLPKLLGLALEEALRKEGITQSEWFRRAAKTTIAKNKISITG